MALAPPTPRVDADAVTQAGAVAVGVADLRRRPDHGSELISQTLLGETVRVLRVGRDRRWLLVAGDEDGYAGWMRSWSLALGARTEVARWRRAARLVVDRPWLARADSAGGALPFGARLARSRGAARIVGPLGAIELVSGARPGLTSEPAPPRGRLLPARGRAMVATAQRFLGVPYHWGGRTFAGLDCSALVQLAARRIGVRLPRDARDQCAAVGGPRRLRPLAEALATGPSRGPRPGDAWFFGPGRGEVTHVALATGGLGLIHAYGRVAWGSLDPLSPVFEPELFRSVLGWGRLTGTPPPIQKRRER